MKSKPLLSLLICLIMNLVTVAQSGFKKGYIINNRQERTNCLIRNIGNPESTTHYQYKLEDSKRVEDIELAKIKEFGIDDELKCIRALILLDVSRNYIRSIKDTIMEWEEGHAYLKTLIEGELASLYSYYDQGQSLFFYSLDKSSIEPLVFKEYKLGVTTLTYQQTLQDNTYQEQLKQHFSCGNFENFSKISYTKKDLVEYFISYHNCKNSNYHQFESAYAKKGILLIKPEIQLNSNQLTIEDPIDAAPNASFTKENNVGFGLELEYIIPFNNYAWSIFAESNYLSYNTDQISLSDTQNAALYDEYSINYKTIEIPFGVNYNINLNQKQRLYVKAGFAPHFIFSDSHIAFLKTHKENFSSSSRFLLGLGYNFHNLGVELRYYTPQNITQNIYKRGSELTQISMKVSYSFQLLGDKKVK